MLITFIGSSFFLDKIVLNLSIVTLDLFRHDHHARWPFPKTPSSPLEVFVCHGSFLRASSHLHPFSNSKRCPELVEVRIILRLIEKNLSSQHIYTLTECFGSSFVYLHIFSFQNRYIDIDLGEPIPEKDYGGNCKLYDGDHEDPWHNIKDKVDIFIVAHLAGYWCKTMIFRDWWLTTVISIMFEFLEYSLEHQLPNFSECWYYTDTFYC